MTRRRKRHPEKQYRLTIKGQFCVYCGEWAECQDDFPPYSATMHGFLLPSCKQCVGGSRTPFRFSIPSQPQSALPLEATDTNRANGTASFKFVPVAAWTQSGHSPRPIGPPSNSISEAASKILASKALHGSGDRSPAVRRNA